MAVSDLDDAHIARQIMALRCRPCIMKEYLQIVLNVLIPEITYQANGIIPGIRREIVLNTLIPLPPLQEQRVIRDKVKAFQQFLMKIVGSLN